MFFVLIRGTEASLTQLMLARIKKLRAQGAAATTVHARARIYCHYSRQDATAQNVAREVARIRRKEGGVLSDDQLRRALENGVEVRSISCLSPV